MEYYRSEQLSDRLYRIIEVDGVCCYLVVGDEKACLLDTNCGYGDIRRIVRQITDKSVMVLLTHAHHDHMGGAALFEEVYMSQKDEPVFASFGTMENRINGAKEFPETADMPVDDIVPTRTEPMKNIEDGDVFDLGGIHIKMIAVPGHTPGMMCPLLVEERTIIFGDACGVGVLLFDKYSSTVSEYRKSLLRLKKLEASYDTIYRNHGTFVSPKDLLDNVITCCDNILNKTDAHEPAGF